MYKRKTVDCYAIEGFYEGYGWSIECNCEDLKDAKVQLKTYRESCICGVVRKYKLLLQTRFTA